MPAAKITSQRRETASVAVVDGGQAGLDRAAAWLRMSREGK